MKGVKAYNKGLICKEFQFEEGKVFETEGNPVRCGSNGFHFCENPLDVLNYYDLCESEFSEVEALGDISKDNSPNSDTKIATNKIRIGAKLDLKGFIKASFDFLYEKCKDDGKEVDSTDFSQVATSGYGSQVATSGDGSKVATSGYGSKVATSGDGSQVATSGDGSKVATSGDGSKVATSGYGSQVEINGEYSVGAGIGYNNKIKGIKGSWITLAEWVYDETLNKYVPICVKSAQIDGVKLKANIWYKLQDKKFVEVKE